MLTIDTLLPYLAALANLATIIGIPAAIYLYWEQKRRERRERQHQTYDELDAKYFEYLALCLKYPELDLYDVPLQGPEDLTPRQKVQQAAMFEVLISLMERAFVMYHDQSTEFRRVQWLGWDTFIRRYCSRRYFAQLWSLVGGAEFDEKFVAYVEQYLKSIAVVGEQQ